MNSAQLINQDSGTVEYYTPSFIVEAARSVMGSITVDPASCEFANRTVKAFTFYDKECNGLDQEWFGNVWMNHPFAVPEQPCKPRCTKKKCQKRGHCVHAYQPGNADWINKLVNEYMSGNTRQACCITFAATSEAWTAPLFDFPVCFLSPRTNYYDANGLPVEGVTKGSMVCYMGSCVERFIQEFKALGRVMLPA